MDYSKTDKVDRPVCSRVTSAVKETELHNRHWFLFMGQFNPVHTHTHTHPPYLRTTSMLSHPST